MDYNKLSPEIFNAEADNLAKLAALFPSAVKDGELDIKALKEELGQFEEVSGEKYEFTWAGKQNAKKLSQTDVVGRTLKYVPEDSKDADTTQNLYIEGDNLEVLKLLRKNYYGIVKMIYIDPPYNTGEDLVYRDNFAISKADSDEVEGETVDGERMVVNQKSSNRYHANWLNMMYPRLRVAKDLLREDGVIFISIDDNEVSQLRKTCDIIFGEDNFVTEFAWEKKKKPSFLHKNVGKLNDYIICYVKNSFTSKAFSVETTTIGKKYPFNNAGNGISILTFPADYVCFNMTDGIVKPQNMSEGNIITELLDTVNIKNGKNTNSFKLKGEWRYSQQKLDEIVSDGDKIIISKIPFRPNHVKSGGEIKKMKNILSPVHYQMETNEDATSQIIDLLGSDIFDNPKPAKLINYLIRAVTYESTNAIVLDFFSGSSTTAHAAMQLNAEDDSNRKFIMVQFKEDLNKNYEKASNDSKAVIKKAIDFLDSIGKPHLITEIGKERIRRAGEKIKAEIKNANTKLKNGEEPKQVPDIGFRVFRTADTNIRWTHEALKGQLEIDASMLSEKDRLDFMPGYTDIDVVYEVLLRQRDIPLSVKIEKLNIGERTYMFADAYVVCLDSSVSTEFIEALAAIEPTPVKYVFRDSAFDDNISLKDETIRRLEAYIVRNSGENKKTYTVDFI